MINVKRAILSCFCGGAIILGASASSPARAAPKVGDAIQGPFYNSATSSYFQLFRRGKGAESRWKGAHVQAQRHYHKGKRGRLAIVKDQKTLQFVRDHFNISGPTWIGLRLFCKIRKLLWVDGQVQSPSAAGMWHRQWYRSPDKKCNYYARQNTYMPIYLTGTKSGGVFWQASGPNKGFNYYLVEFSTSEKSDDVSHNSKGMTIPAGAGTTE